MSPSVHIRTTGGGKYQVRYRVGGRETNILSAGTFRTQKDANTRRILVEGWLAAGIDPRERLAELRTPTKAPTIAEIAEQWRRSRIDVEANTAEVHRKSLAHVLRRFAGRDPASITPADVAAWIGDLASENPPVPEGARKRTAPYSHGSIRKYRDALAMVLDFHGVHPNPVRDARVKLPRQRRAEVVAPESGAVEAILSAVAPRYRLPILVLEATAMRVGELEALLWGDLDSHGVIRPPVPLPDWLGVGEDAARWRIPIESEKAERGRWVPVPRDVFNAVEQLLAREDRDLELPVFAWMNQAGLRREISRAAKATATPLWSPHGLRRRRISMWHRAGVSWAQIGEWAGQRDLSVTANTYTRVITGPEIDRPRYLRDERVMTTHPVSGPDAA